MASQTSLSIDSIIKLYKQNIHPAIAAPASNIERWVKCKTINGKMIHSLTAAGMATQLLKLPSNHPFSTRGTKYALFPGMSQVIGPIQPQSHVRIQGDVDSMQVDGVGTPLRPPPLAWSSIPDVWAKIKFICWTKRFFFRCMKVSDSTHGDPGRFRCPNSVATFDQGLAFLTEHKP